MVDDVLTPPLCSPIDARRCGWREALELEPRGKRCGDDDDDGVAVVLVE